MLRKYSVNKGIGLIPTMYDEIRADELVDFSYQLATQNCTFVQQISGSKVIAVVILLVGMYCYSRTYMFIVHSH